MVILEKHPQFDFTNEHDELVKCIEKHYNVFHYSSRHKKAKGGFNSDYNKALNRLFKAEFVDVGVHSNENNDSYSILKIPRLGAAREAYYQQASLHCSKPKSESLGCRHESWSPYFHVGARLELDTSILGLLQLKHFLCLDKNTRLPLNGLLCIFRKCTERLTSWLDTKQHVIAAIGQLLQWEDATGLGTHMSLQQFDLLQLGESRYCKRRRSEAIMFVIGVTLWYNEVIDGQYEPESDLILDKYSTKFVDELRRLIPIDFYTAYAKSERSEDFREEHIPFKCQWRRYYSQIL